MSQSLNESIYSNSSILSPSSYHTNQSPLYQSTTPEYNYIVTQQPVYSKRVFVAMSSPQETIQVTTVQTSTQDKENILSQALQNIM